MMIGVGTDLVAIDRIAKILARHGERFITRCFAPVERVYPATAKEAAAHYAKRFAAKEAAAKALGTGVRDGLYLKDLVVESLENGAPTLILKGKASNLAAARAQDGMTLRTHLSLSDDAGLALAFVVLEATPMARKACQTE